MKRVATAVAFSLLAFAGAFAVACGDERASTIEGLHGVKLVPPHAKSDFTLEDTQGKPFHFMNDTHGTVTLLYDHHVRMLNEKLTDIQHDHHNVILSTLHVHLDHDHCLEVLVVRGKSAEVRHVADTLISTKGVKHGRLTITSSGTELK